MIGKTKDEVISKIIHVFVGLKSKIDSLVLADRGELKASIKILLTR